MSSNIPEARQTSFTALDPRTTVGPVSLIVADIARSVAYYEALGLVRLEQTDSGETILGVPGTPLLRLTVQAGVRPWPTDRVTGLYHFALLVPTRADLGRWLRHWLSQGNSLPGQSDHLVSEALYLRDPDEHGIEIYRDRPRDQWTWAGGQLQMAIDPLDLRSILAEGERLKDPWTGLPQGTRMGHIHLQVGDIARAEAFYCGVLGFEVMAHMSSALFVSAGKYHHHLGLNVWHSRGGSPADDNTARLKAFTIQLPDEEARSAVLARLDAAAIPYAQEEGGIAVRDPWQNTLLLGLPR